MTFQCDKNCIDTHNCPYHFMYEVLKEDNPCPCNDCIIKMKCHTACPDYNKTNQHRIWHLRNDNYKLYQEYVKKIQTRFPNISIL